MFSQQHTEWPDLWLMCFIESWNCLWSTCKEDEWYWVAGWALGYLWKIWICQGTPRHTEFVSNICYYIFITYQTQKRTLGWTTITFWEWFLTSTKIAAVKTFINIKKNSIFFYLESFCDWDSRVWRWNITLPLYLTN